MLMFSTTASITCSVFLLQTMQKNVLNGSGRILLFSSLSQIENLVIDFLDPLVVIGKNEQFHAREGLIDAVNQSPCRRVGQITLRYQIIDTIPRHVLHVFFDVLPFWLDVDHSFHQSCVISGDPAGSGGGIISFAFLK